MHRFFLPTEQTQTDSFPLTDTEAHHFLNVLRGKEKDRITVFDGAGHEIICTVAAVEKNRVTLRAQSRQFSPPLPHRLTLAQAVPRAKSMDFILQKATELGVARIVPLLSDRTVVQLGGEDIEGKRERWRQITIEAAKQCGANWLPAIEPPTKPRDFFRTAARGELNIIASLQPDSLRLPAILNDHLADHKSRPTSATIVIGPEGDFTPAELADARSAGFRPLSLGPLVLRSETAALYALSILAYELQQEKS